jgi:hypothetical protein
LEKISERLFTHIEIWLKTGVIAPKTISLLERVFRELGRRLKRIAYGWSDKTVTYLSKMILLKQYSRKNGNNTGKINSASKDISKSKSRPYNCSHANTFERYQLIMT